MSQRKKPVTKPREGRCNFNREDGTYCMRYPMRGSAMILCKRSNDLAKRCQKHGGKLQIGQDNKAYRNGLWTTAMPSRLKLAFEQVLQDAGQIVDLRRSIAAMEARLLNVMSQIDAATADRRDVRTVIDGLATGISDDEKREVAIRELESVVAGMRNADTLWAQTAQAMKDHANLVIKYQKFLRDNDMLVDIVRVREILTQIRSDILELVEDESTKRALFDRFHSRSQGKRTFASKRAVA